MTDSFVKDPADRLDYQIDWSAWLDADAIAASAWTVPAGLTEYAASNTTTLATVWLTGGAAGSEYLVTNQITTAGGRIAQRSIRLVVRER